MTDIQKPCEPCEDSNIEQQVSVMDQFIADGGFDQAFKDVFGLPETVVRRLKEVS